MERIPLWERAPLFDESFDQPAPSLTPYLLPGDGARGAVIVCPGGGYGMLAMDHEGYEMAKWFAANGITGAVLKSVSYTHLTLPTNSRV